MSNFNKYIALFDYSWLINFIIQNGTMVKYHRNELFCTAGKHCKTMGFIHKGTFIYSTQDTEGERHVVGYAFENSFVGDYGAFRLRETSDIDITALCESEVYLITYEALNRFITEGTENRERFLHIMELMYFEVYQRFISSYIQTPEERYQEILHRCPDIFHHTTAKDLASYLQIAPETLSRIRRKLKQQ